MKYKSVIASVVGVGISLFLFTGIAYAASINAASKLGGGDGDFFDFGNSTLQVGSIKIGKQDAGGVTFFNGTIINNTTSEGADNPVTISDNLRVDGGIQRGHNKPSDGWGVKILDDIHVYGNVTFDRKTNYIAFAPGNFHEYVDFSDIGLTTCVQTMVLVGLSCDTDSGTTPAIFVAPVNLPHGARIDSFSFDYFDNESDASVGLWLVKKKSNVILEDSTFVYDDVILTKGDSGKTNAAGIGHADITGINEVIDYSVTAFDQYEIWVVLGDIDTSTKTFSNGVQRGLAYLGGKMTYSYEEIL